jgi:formyl-CoA transferase
MPNVFPYLSRTPGSIRTTGPQLGEHNEEVYCGELGMERAELAALRAQGVI